MRAARVGAPVAVRGRVRVSAARARDRGDGRDEGEYVRELEAEQDGDPGDDVVERDARSRLLAPRGADRAHDPFDRGGERACALRGRGDDAQEIARQDAGGARRGEGDRGGAGAVYGGDDGGDGQRAHGEGGGEALRRLS